MAKSEEELIEEAKSFEAKAKESREKAKQLKEKKFAQLGKYTIDFINKKIDKEQLKDEAIRLGFIKQEEEKKEDEETVNNH